MDPAERIYAYPGKRTGSTRYFHGGFSYHADSRNRFDLRCSMRSTNGCPGVLHLREDGTVEDQVDHEGHAADLLNMQKTVFKEEIYRKCRTTNDTFIDIFNSTSREFREVAGHFRIDNLLSQMKKERRKNVPRTPESLIELSEILINYHAVRGVFRGSAITDEGDCAIIFVHPEMEEPLRRCTQLYMDGTFKILPRIPRDIAQMYTIHFRRLDSGFPAIFVLCNRRTTNLYEAMWDKVFEVIPELANNVNSIMVDFERAAINATRNKFPNARISGCLFHYKQALIKYWCKRLRARIDANVDVLETAMALPFLPDNLFQEGIVYITRMADESNEETLARFATYLRRTWLPLAPIVSVYQLAIRSNNTCENFHRKAYRKFNEHPTLYKYLDVLLEIMVDNNINYNRIQNGLVMRRARRTAQEIQNDVVLLDLQSQLATGRISVEEFLQTVMMQRRLQYFPQVSFEDQRAAFQEDLEANAEEDRLFVQLLQRVFVPDPGNGNDFENEEVQPGRRRGANVRIVLRNARVEVEDIPLAERVGNRRFRGRGGRARGRGLGGGAHRGPERAEIVRGALYQVDGEIRENNVPIVDPVGNRRARRGRGRGRGGRAPAEVINEVQQPEQEQPADDENMVIDEDLLPDQEEPANENAGDNMVMNEILLPDQEEPANENAGNNMVMNEILLPDQEEPANENAGNNMVMNEILLPDQEEPDEQMENNNDVENNDPLLQMEEEDLIRNDNADDEGRDIPEQPQILNQRERDEIPTNNHPSRQADRNRRRREQRRDIRNGAVPVRLSRNQRKRLHNKLKLATAAEALHEERSEHTRQLQILSQQIIKCVACQEAAPSNIFKGCKHVCLCDTCLEEHKNIYENVQLLTNKIKCPICRTFNRVSNVYIS